MDEDLKSVHASCGSSTGSQFLRLFKGNNKKRKMNENLPASTNNYTGTSRATAPIPDEIQIITRPSIVESNPDPDEALSPEIRSSTTEGASSEVIGLFPSSPSGTTTPMLAPLFFMDGLSEKRASTSSITETSSTHDTLAATRTPRPNEDSSAWEQPSSSKVTIEDAEKEVLMDEKATVSISLSDRACSDEEFSLKKTFCSRQQPKRTATHHPEWTIRLPRHASDVSSIACQGR